MQYEVKKYTKYKDSGIAWLGDIPEHWDVKRIGYTTYVKGRIGWQGLTSDEFIDEGPYCVTGTDFQNGKISWNTCYHVDEKRYNEDPYIKLQEMDLLITKDGTIGKTAIVKNLQTKATLNSGIFLTRPLKHIYMTNFMYWVLNSNIFKNFIDLTKTGTTISHLYQNVFVRFLFPLPPLPEQEAIAAFLDRETGHIDSLVAKKQKLIELLQEKRTALISHAVTKGLNPSVRLKPSGIAWLGDIPEHWDVKRTNFAFSIQLGKMLQPEASSKDDSQVEYLKALHVQWEKVDTNNLPVMWASPNEILKYSVYKGDLLVCEGGEVGRAGILKEVDGTIIIQNALHRVRSHNNSNLFLLYVLQHASSQKWFEILCNKATIAHFTEEKFSALKIPLPPLPEQEAIAEYLDQETARIDMLVTKIQAAIEKLREYRTALISSAVTGKIDVRE